MTELGGERGKESGKLGKEREEKSQIDGIGREKKEEGRLVEKERLKRV